MRQQPSASFSPTTEAKDLLFSSQNTPEHVQGAEAVPGHLAESHGPALPELRVRSGSCEIKHLKQSADNQDNRDVCSGTWESRAATGVGRAGNSAEKGGIPRNLSATGQSAGVRRAVALGRRSQGGAGVRAAERGRIRAWLGTRRRIGREERAGECRGGGPCDHPDRARRRRVTAGALGQPGEGPQLQAREVCGDSRWGSRAGSREGRPRGREAERKRGAAVPDAPVPTAAAEARLLQVAGTGRGSPRWWGRDTATGAWRRDPASRPPRAAPDRRCQTLFCSRPGRPAVGLGRGAAQSAA